MTIYYIHNEFKQLRKHELIDQGQYKRSDVFIFLTLIIANPHYILIRRITNLIYVIKFIFVYFSASFLIHINCIRCQAISKTSVWSSSSPSAAEPISCCSRCSILIRHIKI